ncbi:MAG TPA: hypothetical protein VGC88_03835 [Terriglobales bacterium]|jgi:hypothetical protein
MPPDSKLVQLARELLDIAKENLQRDKELVPVALMIDDDYQIIGIEGITFKTHDEKAAAFQGVIEKARELEAMAIVTISDMFQKKFENVQQMSEYVGTYSSGDLARDHTGELIELTVTGPSVESYSITQSYVRQTPEMIVFTNMSESTNFDFPLLEGWIRRPLVQ